MKQIAVLLLAAFCCWAVFAGGGGASPEAPEPPETSERPEPPEVPEPPETSEIDRILSGREPIPAVDAGELDAAFRQEADNAGHWFRCERHALVRFLIGAGCAVAFGGALAFQLRRVARHPVHGRGSWRRRLLLTLAAPGIVFLVAVTVFVFLLPVLRSLPELYPWDARIFFTLLTLIAAWTGFELISLFDMRLRVFARRPDNNLDALMVDITRKLLKIALVCMTILFIGQSIFHLNITTLLAGAGVLGLAVAFASRETLSNFFGTMVIILDRPFRCGDRIQVAGIDGIVESVGMRSTRIRTGNESVFTVPNSTIASSNVENISVHGVIRYALTLGLSYKTAAGEMARAIRIVHDIADNFHGPDAPEHAPRVFFESFGASALQLRIIVWFKTGSFAPEEAWRTEFNLELLRRFEAAGLEIAYNTVTNIVEGALEIHPAKG